MCDIKWTAKTHFYFNCTSLTKRFTINRKINSSQSPNKSSSTNSGKKRFHLTH